MNWIPLNRPYITGDELGLVGQVINSRRLSGHGEGSRLTLEMIEGLGYTNAALTPSCSSALEAVGLHLNIQPGDEVIVPSYTFVATASAFANLGAKIIFADSLATHPNLDCATLESLITKRTKAIVVVHYAGMSCDMEVVNGLGRKYNLAIIDDAAHSFFARNNDGTWVGIQGDYSCFSFHETKNIVCGEGGMLIAKDKNQAISLSNVLNKGTDRLLYEIGKVDHYQWVSKGGSYGLSELQTAFLYAQVKKAEMITNLRRAAWDTLFLELAWLAQRGQAKLPTVISEFHNGHIFYLMLNSETQVRQFIAHMQKASITCATHYVPLHQSTFGKQFVHNGVEYPNASHFGSKLVRIPVFSDISNEEIERILGAIRTYFAA